MSIPPPGPLAYEGQVVVPFIVRDFPPTTAFNQFSVPTIWIEPTAENAYILTGKPLGVANWLLFVNGGGNVGTLKGNTGGSVSPTAAGLINVVGDGTTITIAGTPGTNTLTASLVGGQEAIDSFQPDSGTNPVVPNAAGLVTMSGSGSITTVGSLNTLTTQLTGLTNHNVLVGAGTSTITKVPPSTAGFVLTSNGAAADPSFQTVSASGAITTITGNSGGAETPTAGGNFNILGTGSITVAGSANTETVQLTGLTNHAVLVGAATATITNVGPSATTGAPLISGGAAADPGFSTTVVINDAAESLTLSAGANAIQPTIVCKNTWNTAGGGQASSIIATAHSSASQSDVGYFSSGQWDGPKYWNFGMTSTASAYANAFNINYATGTTAPEGGTVMMSISNSSGLVTIPTGDLYVSRSQNSGGPQISLQNTSTTVGATARATIATNADGALSDAYTLLVAGSGSGSAWEYGCVGATKNFQIQSGPSNTHSYMDGTARFSIAQTGAITFNSAFTFPTADGTAGQVLTTNGAGTVTWSSSGAGGWSVIGASQTLAVNNGYFCTTGGALSLALPAVSAVGDEIDVVLDGSTSWTITQPNAATRIRIGSNQTTLGVGGSLASTLAGDSVKLVCETANARWAVISMIGNITVV